MNAAIDRGISADAALLARQRTLDIELAQARQATRGVRRKVVFDTLTPDEPEDEGWTMTYLDVMTLLLVVTLSMLALAGAARSNRPAFAPAPPPAVGHGLLPGELARLGIPREALPARLSMLTLKPFVAPAEPAVPVAAANPPAVESAPPAAEIAQTPAPPKPTAQALLEQLPLQALGKDIEVLINEGSVSFRISSEILFRPGQSDLSLDGLSVLRQLLPVFAQTTHTIVVGGHTDSTSISSARFPSNWELSGARAGSVVRYLVANGVPSPRLRAVGYADTQPLADNTSATGRAQNRRVELLLETSMAAAAEAKPGE